MGQRQRAIQKKLKYGQELANLEKEIDEPSVKDNLSELAALAEIPSYQTRKKVLARITADIGLKVREAHALVLREKNLR